MKASIFALCALSLAACGDPGHLDGKVGGHSITLKSGVFGDFDIHGVHFDGPLAGTPGTFPAVDSIFTDDPNMCAHVGAPLFKSGHSYVMMHLHQPYYVQGSANASPPVSAGYYSAQDPNAFDPSKQGGQTYFYFLGPNCNRDAMGTLATATPLENLRAVDGGVLVNSISISAGGSLDADVDVKIGPQADALKGSVHAQYCAPLVALLKKANDVDDAGGAFWSCE